MILSNKQSIEDIIVEKLAQRPYVKGGVLVSEIQNFRENTTKQAIYVALRFLIVSEIVAKVGGKYFLSRVWLEKAQSIFGLKKSDFNDAIFDLSNKQTISYRFPSLLTCDTYWAHIFNLLIDWIPTSCPIFVWNPHEWFILARRPIETSIFKIFQEKDKYAFYTIQGNTSLDKDFKKTWTNSHVSIHINESVRFPSNYYLNIFGDFLIEVFIEKKLSEQIHNFYQKHSQMNSENTIFFEELISEKHLVRMKISRNKEKALVIAKKLSKDFYIPKHLHVG